MYRIERYKRFWALYLDGELLAVMVYKKGAKNIQRLLQRDTCTSASSS